MSKVIVVASVHHTGTKYVYRHLLKDSDGWAFIVPNPDTKAVERELKEAGATKGKVRIHIDTPLMPRLHAFMKDFPTIVPLRHPRAVAQSWKNKQKDFAELDVQWKLLKDEVDTYDPYYLPLDSDIRYQYMKEINIDLGIPGDPEWPIICKGADEFRELTDEDEKQIASWMEDGFFERFGYEY